MKDIFDFWEGVKGSATQHDDDRTVLSALDTQFDLRCLVANFHGRLRDAPVVLLLLSPGLGDGDHAAARDPRARAYYAKMRRGDCPLPTLAEHPGAYKWDRRILTQFGCDNDDATVRNKVAVLNICAYKSKTFTDWAALAALPSSRVCLDWAQGVLFPQARAGERVVVCLRSPKYWGLKKGTTDGSLFAPATNQAAFMEHGEHRERIAHAVQSILRNSK